MFNSQKLHSYQFDKNLKQSDNYFKPKKCTPSLTDNYVKKLKLKISK